MQALNNDEKRKDFLIVVFGKDGCPHCDTLYENVVSVLDSNQKEDFSLDFQNLSKRQGLVAFAKSETINGQRIPALQIMKLDKNDNSYKKIIDSRKEEFLVDENKYFYSYLCQDGASGRLNIHLAEDGATFQNQGFFMAKGFFGNHIVIRRIPLRYCH